MRTLNLVGGCGRVAGYLFLGILGAGVMCPAAGAQGAVLPETTQKTILWHGAMLEDVRQQSDLAILYQARAEADKAMKAPLFSVIDKQATPPSGNKHDYMSMAPYWWPNPATPNHLPYVRKDGEHNPEATALEDHAHLSRMESNVHALALGYFLTRDDKYAARAAEQLRVWFLNPATRMNPTLKYAQAIRGVNEGRGTGILDAAGLSDVVDALGLLAGSPSWTASDEAGMHSWFVAYFDWLTTSAYGKDEEAAKNNHGSWYDEQAVGIALYIGKIEFARKVAEAAKTKHIAVQIQPDGDQPLEDVRTRSFHYSIYNLEALMKLATEAEVVHVDLWNYMAPGGGSIRAALDYLVPFAENRKKWEHRDLDGVSEAPLRDPLLIAAVRYNAPDYEKLALATPSNDLRTLLLEREFARLQKAGR